MIKVGDIIKIKNSASLKKSGVSGFAGKKAIVLRTVVSENIIIGVVVKLKNSKNNVERYIPIESVETSEMVNKLKSASILKSIILN